MIETVLTGRALAPQLLGRICASTLPAWFTRRDILQRNWARLSSPGAVGAALRFLDENGFLESDRTSNGGRPTVRYRLASRASDSGTTAGDPVDGRQFRD
jgi:hypothetical protein